MSASTRLTRVLSAIRRLWSSTAERDLSDDVQAYVDMLTDEYTASGMSSAAARQRALREAGGVEAIKASVREVRAGALLEQTGADARYAWRGLRRSPAYALTVVLTLGLGLGVNTTVFSILNTALLKPLPYERPEELVELAHRLGEGPDARRSFGLSWQELAFWRSQQAIFTGAEARQRSAQRYWQEGGESLLVGAFTAGFPELLGVRPVVGRVFTRDEAMRDEPVVVISDGFWARSFGRSPSVLGTTLTIDDRPLTVVGVMPPTFRYGTAAPAEDGRVHVFRPLAERGGGTSAILRLQPGLTIEHATALAVAPAQRFQAEVPPREPWTPELVSTMPQRGLFSARRQPMVWLLFAVSTMVLVVACANVANVLASRTFGRSRELAVRAALGASRQRIARMLFCEGVVVTACGAVVAVVMAKWASAAIYAMTPSRIGWEMFAVSPPDLDWRVLSFAIVATGLAAFLAALWPALLGARAGRFPGLAGGIGTTSGLPGRRRVAAGVQAAQVSLVLILAVTAALFVRSLSHVLTADLGFDPEGLLKVNVSMPTGRYASPNSRVQALNALVGRIRDVPGVSNAAVGNSPPMPYVSRMARPGETLPQNRANASVRYAGPGYLETAGITLISGRDFGPADTINAPLVAIIDDAGARRAFPGESPLGQTFSTGPGDPQRTIVGVVRSISGMEFPLAYGRIGLLYPQLQEVEPDDSPFGFTVIVRATRGDPKVLPDVRRTVLAFEPLARITGAEPVIDFYTHSEAYATPRYYAALVSALALIAVLTAGVGLYGALAFSVGQRTREIGVRLALGSTRWQIRRLVLREVLTPVVVGLAVGALGLWLGGGLVESQLHGVTTFDPWALAASAAVLLLVAVAAVTAPIRRATGTDPLLALRTD